MFKEKLDADKKEREVITAIAKDYGIEIGTRVWDKNNREWAVAEIHPTLLDGGKGTMTLAVRGKPINDQGNELTHELAYGIGPIDSMKLRKQTFTDLAS